MATAQSQPRSRRQILAVWLLAVQLLTALSAWIAAWFNVETILVTGPLLSVTGLAFAVVVRQRGSWSPVLFGVSAPAVCALGAFVIAAFHLGPEKAHGPILVIFTTYSLSLLPASLFVLAHIWNWPEVKTRSIGDPWRYSLKSLLVVMTAVAIVSAVCASIFKSNLPDYFVFGGFASGAMVLIALVVWRFYIHRLRVGSRLIRAAPLHWREWLRVYVLSQLLPQEDHARCSFCGRRCDNAGSMVEGRYGGFICAACAQRCSRQISEADRGSLSEQGKLTIEASSL
jgi:hypothetical protein